MKLDLLLADSKRICSRKNKFEDLPVSKDIYRLAKKFTVTCNKITWNFDKETDPLFGLLQVLGKELQDVTLDKKEYDTSVNPNDHYSISKYIVTKFGETGVICT